MKRRNDFKRMIRQSILLLLTCSLVGVVFTGCGSKESQPSKEDRKLGNIWDIELENVFEVVFEARKVGSISFCNSQQRKLEKYAKEILNMQLGKEIEKIETDFESLMFEATITFDNQQAADNTLKICQYEDGFMITLNDGKPKYYENNISEQRACMALRDMIKGTQEDGLPGVGGTGDMRSAKPVIYLYPRKKSNIHVEVDGIDFTTVYPDYQNGWDVQAETDGTLYSVRKDCKGNEYVDRSRSYYSLYYEGDGELSRDWEDGFVVEKKDYTAFLEEKLKILGLTDREAQEFIIYWLPQMQEYDKVQIHFEEQGILEEKVPLTITPKPDTTIRVFMKWKEASGDEKLCKQELTKVKRRGYTVVEWGGSQVK